MRMVRPAIPPLQVLTRFCFSTRRWHGLQYAVEVTLRPFRRHDFNDLWKIDQVCFPTGIAYTKHELSDYIQRRNGFTMVAESMEGKQGQEEDHHFTGIAGFIVAETSQRSLGHIITLDVLPIARRTGAGSKLLQAAEEWLKAARCVRVALEAAIDNTAALAFYKRHGYEITGKLPAYYDNGLDAYSLDKRL
jgi:ribosomal-protein-alanine N-acetyltransferase